MAKFSKSKVILISLGTLVFVTLFVLAYRLSSTEDNISSISKADNLLIFPTKAPPVTTSEVHSPDGKMKLVMKKTGKSGSSLSVYTFTVSDINGGSPKVIYSTTLPDEQGMSLPPNSWSPDNKLLFLKEGEVDNAAYFVFKADGSAFADGKANVDIGPLFVAKVPDYKLSEVTGWDSDTLLHVFTTAKDGRGPSYWFDVDSRSFLILATR